jgi:hypothetical protein
MSRPFIAALVACSLGGAARAEDWTERYFGVGSAQDHVAACGQARDHAQGNSFKACIDRRGRRGEAEYTECICATTGEQIHVCNVNLKVRCGAGQSGSDQGSLPSRGVPKGRAGRRVQGTVHRQSRPGPEVLLTAILENRR